MSEVTAFECPECGRVFERAPALGAHRRRSHGIAGTSRRRRPKATRTATHALSNELANLDRDTLLQALFPAGLPASASLLRDVQAWLEEAERLASASASASAAGTR